MKEALNIIRKHCKKQTQALCGLFSHEEVFYTMEELKCLESPTMTAHKLKTYSKKVRCL